MPDVVRYNLGIASGSQLLHEMALKELWPADVGNVPSMLPMAACRQTTPLIIIRKQLSLWTLSTCVFEQPPAKDYGQKVLEKDS